MACLMYANEHKGFLPGPYAIINPPAGTGNYINGVTTADQQPTQTGWLYTTGLLKDPRVWLCPADHRIARARDLQLHLQLPPDRQTGPRRGR